MTGATLFVLVGLPLIGVAFSFIGISVLDLVRILFAS